MAIWSDIAVWQGNSPNNSGHRAVTKGLVLHIAEGSYEGTIAWGRNPSAGVSYHFVIARDGRMAQTLDTDLIAWTQADGNGTWLSVEFEGHTGDSLTPAALESAARLYAKVAAHYAVPLALATSPSMRGLGHHSMGGAAWGNHPNCPGQPIINQKPAILSRANQLLGGGSVNPGTLRGSTMYFAKLSGKQEVFLTNGLEAVWLSPQSLADFKTLAAEGRVDIPKTDVRTVGNRGVLGVIKGNVPPGYTANP